MKVLQLGALRRTDRTQWRRRRLTLVTLAVIALAMIFWVAGAFADAGNPILGTIRATAVDNGNGTVTVFVRGQWNWYSHNSDCNTNRAGAGVGLIWNDPTEPGYTVSKGNISAGVGISSLRSGDAVNSVDRMVHPSDVGNMAEGYPGFAGQVFFDPATNNPSLFATWRGGCGREPLTATASPGPGTALEPSGTTCADGTTNCNGHPWGSWGYSKNAGEGYSHTYVKTYDPTPGTNPNDDQTSGLPSEVCVNFYDVHGGGTGTKLQDVNSANEITVDANGDNSIETNAFNVNVGANCVSVVVSSLTTSATDTTIEGSISDTATLSGVPAGAGGTITFNAYGPRSLASTTPDCSGAVQYTKTVTVNGPGDYGSGNFTPTAVGKYDWKVDYSGAGLVLPAHSACGATNVKETSSVVPFNPTVITNAGPTVALVNGSASLTDKATLAGGSSDISGTITFKLFADNGSGGCGTQVGSDSTKTVSGLGDYTSDAISVSSAGTYHWIANYGGDPKNNATANTCNAANENVLVQNPGILISKDPNNQTIVSGGTATFHITVTNTGDATLTSVHVTDALAPGCARTAAQIAAIAPHNSSTFAPGDTVTYDCTLANVTADFTNSATATGTPPTGPDVTSTDTADVDVIHPSIDVTKGPDSQTIVSGGTATFTITVKNDSTDATLLNVHVTDAQAPGCARTAAEIAAIPQDTTGILSSTFLPGASLHYQCTLGNVTAGLTNSATGCGTPDASGSPADVCDTGTAPVTVIHPSIKVAKDPDSQTVATGTTATFTIKVTNDSTDATLLNVHVTDAQAPGCARTAAQIAADRGSSTFAPGDTYSYTCTLTNVTASFTNVATSCGTPDASGSPADVCDSNPADVVVVHPAITISKDPKSQSVQTGNSVTFTIKVTNTGDVDLTDVTVTDPNSPNCAKTIGALAQGASTTFTCTSPVLTADLHNIATVTGKAGGATVTASDFADVTVTQPPATPPSAPTHPAISVTKLPATQNVTTGGTVTFTIEVTNTGDVTLTNVVITDALSPGCARTKADVPALASMAPGAKVTYQCTSPAVTASFTNVAVATGTPPSGPNVTASASAAVVATAPATPAKPVVKKKPKVVSHKKPKATG
jgi:uncharacterized repeat protein (TIGR01451 family)